MTVRVRRTSAGPLLNEAAHLLDEYRQHYGANPAPDAVARWMREQVIAERMRVYVADPGEQLTGEQLTGEQLTGPGDQVSGVATVAVVPASLTLRTVWLLRDLYVEPGARRHGVARALLAHVADAARAEGAHRVSLQTEAANTRALELYAQAGFEPVADVTLLNRIL
jgi:GNAT superfamily N-acetyltransferase